jgi:hypothetical protein
MLLAVRFRGTGAGLSDARTSAIALSTNVRAADLADADELMITSPKAIATNKITRSVAPFFEVDDTRVEVERDVMGALLWKEG